MKIHNFLDNGSDENYSLNELLSKNACNMSAKLEKMGGTDMKNEGFYFKTHGADPKNSKVYGGKNESVKKIDTPEEMINYATK